MQKRKLGLTGIDVSLICLGTMTWGRQNTEAEGHEQMDYAVSSGINFFDTAEMYAVPPSAETYGRTEEIIGSWFAKTKKRAGIVLATKVAGPAPAMPWIRGGTNKVDAANINAAVDGSLKRLQTDYIDLYQIHWPQRPVNTFGKLGFEEAAVTGRERDDIYTALEAMGALMKAGKIRAVGLSNETPWGVMQFLNAHNAEPTLPRVASVQNPYSLLNRSFEVGLAEIAMQESVGLMAYAPLAAGTLTGKYLDGALPQGSRRAIDARPSRYKKPREDEAVRAYLGIAAQHGLDPAQMAIAFGNSRPFMMSNIIGATRMEYLKTVIDAVNVSLSQDVIDAINAVHASISNPCP
jgi:aryl-alcohol dehydrogenase-like predicted oxidoreductase